MEDPLDEGDGVRSKLILGYLCSLGLGSGEGVPERLIIPRGGGVGGVDEVDGLDWCGGGVGGVDRLDLCGGAVGFVDDDTESLMGQGE